MDKKTADKQWEFCPFCGEQKIPHPRHVDHGNGNKWLICPKDLEYHKVAYQSDAPEPRPKLQCLPPPVLSAPFIHGAYYRGKCRNAHLARYNAVTDRFIYIREKFGYVYTEAICHAGCANGLDLFEPYAIMENPPFEISLVLERETAI